MHGWNHQSHAGPGEKKQELGGHRPAAIVLEELRHGLAKLRGLYGEQLLPMLVPPWNRIDKALLPALPGLGFTALSVFGREKRGAVLALLNTHVDVMDWRGTRVGVMPISCLRNWLPISPQNLSLYRPSASSPIIWFMTKRSGIS